MKTQLQPEAIFCSERDTHSIVLRMLVNEFVYQMIIYESDFPHVVNTLPLDSRFDKAEKWWSTHHKELIQTLETNPIEKTAVSVSFDSKLNDTLKVRVCVYKNQAESSNPLGAPVLMPAEARRVIQVLLKALRNVDAEAFKKAFAAKAWV